MKKHLIIDGNNLVHRAYWISNNNNANHIFITLRSVKSYVEQFKPDKIWCAWDMRKSSELAMRKSIDTEYKQTRDSDYNKQVHDQTDTIITFFEKLGITNIYPSRGEADDIIFWLTKHLEGEKVVISADTDLLQLISDETVIYSPVKKILFDKQKFKEDFGFTPDKYAFYKSIVGDKADNITGLDRVGPKTAIKILSEEISLTEDQKSKISDNMKLILLDNTSNDCWEEEYKFYNEQITKDQKCDFTSFMEMCESFNFKTIINQQTIWHKAFCIKSVMNNIITELFSCK